MEKSKNFTNMIICIIISFLLTISILSIMLFKKFNNNNKNYTNQTLQQENTNTIINYSNESLELAFLKMNNNQTNLIYSPLSISYALQMLEKGANNDTLKQINNVTNNLSLTKYNNIKNVFSLANSIFIKDTYKKYIKKDYVNLINNNYNAEINFDKFKNAKNINNWIENKTFGQIKNMLNDDQVNNSNTVAFLINALAMNMEWNLEFDPANTMGKEFYIDENKTIISTTLKQTKVKDDNISYYIDDNITALSMNLKKYDNNQFEFIAIMPNNNLSDYIKNIEIEDLNNIINNLKKSSETKDGINIQIPKFSFDYDLNLKDNLKKLGMNNAFNSHIADFSNMSSNQKPIYVNNILHKANIDFTEKGIKASAVTVVIMDTWSSIIDESKLIDIFINKPFMFLIKDKNSKQLLFIGTVYKPNSWNSDKKDYR